MRVGAFLAALVLGTGLTLAPALAQEGKTITVTVKVKDHDKQQLIDADVKVKKGGTDEVLAEGKTGTDGSVKLKVPPGKFWVHVHANSSIAQTGAAFAISASKDASVDVETDFDVGAERTAVLQAVKDCDGAAYDRHVANIKAVIAEQDRRVAELKKEAEDFASKNDIPYPDLESAQAALKAGDKALKAGLTSVSGVAVDKLDSYVRMLQRVERAKSTREFYQVTLDQLPARPACKTGAMAPNGCPDGSGGLLAGTLNSVFGSDIQAACDEPQRRRDTERHEHDSD